MKLLIVTILIFSLNLVGNSQNEGLDKIRTDIASETEDSIRIQMMIELANECRYYFPEDIVKYNEEAFILSEEVNYSLGSGLALKGLGNYYADKGNYDSAMQYYMKAELVFKKLGNKKQLANVIGSYCHICIAQGEYNKALEAGFSALHLAEESKDTSEIQNASEFIGYTYYVIGDVEQSFIYLEKALGFAETTNDLQSLASIYSELAMVYELNDENDKAIRSYKKASELLKGSEDQRALAISIFNTAEAYRCQKDYLSAIINYHESYKIVSKLNDSFSVTQLLLKIYDAYNGLLKSGKNTGFANSIIRQVGYRNINELLENLCENLVSSKNKNDLLICYQLLAELNKLQSDYNTAFIYNTKLITLKDKLSEANKANVLAELRARFASRQHEKKLELLDAQSKVNEEEINLQRQQQFIIIIIAGLLIILGIGLRQRIKTIRKTKTKLEEINEQLEQEKLRAERSERFKERFLTHVSHEIRTPMNAIMGITNLLVKNKHYTAQEKYLEAMNISSRHLLGLINDILDLSKLESGNTILVSNSFSMRETINQLKNEFQTLAAKKSIRFTINYDDNIPQFLTGDENMLLQILKPLCRNGIEFTEVGGVTLLCKLNGITEKIGIIGFTVKDTGTGIENELHDKIFSQILGEAQFDKQILESSGLELILVKQMVELQGGTISFDSEPGKGTTFYFEIPYQITQDKDLETVDLPKKKTPGMQASGLSILLVDDNEFNIMVAKEELEDALENVIIEVATNGQVAVDKFAESRFDVVLMDIQMPIMDGYAATKSIRAMKGETARTPIIAMTANVMKSEVDKCFAAGMNGYVSKPFAVSDLLDELQKVLNQ